MLYVDELMAVRIRSEALDGKGADRWYVTDGMNAVGPVRLDLLARGVEAGRVPLDSFVRHEGWKVWRPLTDFTEVVDDGAGPGTENKQTARTPLSSASFIDEEPSHEEGRPTMEVTSSGAHGFAASSEAPTLGSAELAAQGEANMAEPGDTTEVPTELGRDLLGADRPTLESYLDDEETKIPVKSSPRLDPPRPRTVPPPVPPRPRTVPPPRLASTSSPPRPRSVAPGPASPGAVPPAPQLRASRQPQTDDVPSSNEGWGFALPPGSADVLPEDELAGASDLSDGLLLLLGAAVRRAQADVALLHKVADEGATVVCAHGPAMVEMLGLRTRLLDAAVVAAAGGHTVVAEPVPGHGGEATVSRLAKLGVEPEGAAMFPLRPKNRLLGFLEIGKKARFTMKELARVEALVAAFSRKAAESGWGP